MLMYRNFVADREDMTTQIRTLIETKWHFISEWRSSSLVNMIQWHESYGCHIKHIVPINDKIISVVSEKPSDTYREILVDTLHKLHTLIPSSNLVI